MINILVIGEFCVDKFVYCNTNRLCPEAPVPVLIPFETVENDGMSGNVIKNLLSLNKDLSISHWTNSQKITKTRYVDKKSNHLFFRIDEGDNSVENFELTKDKINEIGNFDIVIVSDYDKGFLSLDDLKNIGENSKLSILDTKKIINGDITKSFSFIKLNEKEFENNKNLNDSSNILITLGEKGCRFNNIDYPSIDSKETIDVSGAGDTFTSSFILKYFETDDIPQSIKFANLMSSIVVSKKGVSVPF
jgi:bifunctional ADP-heptose synthase (sugar kinase/adenylyltransferase)